MCVCMKMRGYSLMVKFLFAKENMRVRFPLPARKYGTEGPVSEIWRNNYVESYMAGTGFEPMTSRL